MTQTILIIDFILLVVLAVSMAICIKYCFSVQNKMKQYGERCEFLEELLFDVTQEQKEREKQFEEQIESAYELGYKESKMSIVMNVYNKCCQCDNHDVKEWLINEYDIEVKNVK